MKIVHNHHLVDKRFTQFHIIYIICRLTDTYPNIQFFSAKTKMYHHSFLSHFIYFCNTHTTLFKYT